MAVGTGVGVDEGEIVGVVVEVLAVDDIVVGTGSSAGVEVKERRFSTQYRRCRYRSRRRRGQRRSRCASHQRQHESWDRKDLPSCPLQVVAPISRCQIELSHTFLHSQRDIKDKHSILEHRGLHSHLGFPVCSQRAVSVLLPHQPLEGKAGVYNHEAAQAIPSNWASLAARPRII